MLFHSSIGSGISRRTGSITAAIILCAVPATSSSQATPDSLQLDSTKVEIRINGKATSVAMLGSDLVMNTKDVTIKSGDQVKSLLRESGIVPDASALWLFYRLNPLISDADNLAIGSSVKLPSIDDSGSGSGATAGRVSFAVVVDTSYKAVLRDQAKQIAQLTDSLRKLEQPSPERRLIVENAISIRASTNAIVQSSIPLSAETVVELSNDLHQYKELVGAAISEAGSNEKVAVAGKQVAVHATELAKATTNGENSRATVEIAVRNTQGAPRSNIRIVYVRPIYESDRTRFESIVNTDATDVSSTMDLGPWKMWVEDLTGTEVSLSRETKRISTDTRKVTLIVR